MAKVRGVDAKLNRLRLLRDEPLTPAVVAELRTAMGDPSSLVVTEAAQIAGTRGLTELTPELAAAFDRFMVNPETTDKLCRAKIAIVEALNKLDRGEADVFLRGIRYVMPPLWGDEDRDAAAPLRGGSAFGLVRIRHPDALTMLTDLLLDRDHTARVAAVQALGQAGWLAALPLLRFKARIGDKEPAVTAECLTALLGLAFDASLPLVAAFLHGPTAALQEGAAFALAESRRPEALAALIDFWPHASGCPIEEAILLAIAMLRLPAAVDFLLDIVTTAKPSTALAALNALAIHRHSDALRQRIADAVAQRGDPTLRERFQAKFDTDTADRPR